MRPINRIAGIAATSALVLGAAVVVAPGASAGTITVKANGTVVATYRGNGHGHGLSQYGAYGAALAGLSAAQILAHYYPGTKVTTLSGGTVRVLLSGAGTTTTVRATSGLHVTGVAAALPTSGVARYRLVADSGSTLTLQRLSTKAGAKYANVKTHIPANAEFAHAGGGTVTLYRTDGTSVSYYGYLRSVRVAKSGSAASGVHTVNRVGYNAYAAGVTPREMPASWSVTATDAQAVAARSYAVYEKQHAGSQYYDICDTTACQVYGGHQQFSSKGKVTLNDLPRAAANTKNKVLTYGGKVIFAQYAASNGGWSVAGGQPYLRAAADPYDPGKSHDPYVDAKRTVSVKSIASYAGLATVTRISITKRDGHGAWGGRALSATVSGTTSSRKAASKTLTGYDLQAIFGLGTTWMTLAAGK